MSILHSLFHPVLHAPLWLLPALLGCGGVAMDVDSDSGDHSQRLGMSYPATAVGAMGVEQGLAHVNAFRATASLPPATLDPVTSELCAGHLRYLAEEAKRQGNPECLLGHDEPDVDNPHYSPEREAVGKGALIACVPPTAGGLGSARAVDRWMNSLYHRLPLLAPNLTTIGLAEADGYVCLHYKSGTRMPTEATTVVWPPEGLQDVPTGFVGRETPCPTYPSDPRATTAEQCPGSGFIITATWYSANDSPTFQIPPTVNATNLDRGETIPLMAEYADGVAGLDPVPGLVPHTVALVPASALPASSRMRVEVDTVVDGQPTHLSWDFFVGTRSE